MCGNLISVLLLRFNSGYLGLIIGLPTEHPWLMVFLVISLSHVHTDFLCALFFWCSVFFWVGGVAWAAWIPDLRFGTSFHIQCAFVSTYSWPGWLGWIIMALVLLDRPMKMRKELGLFISVPPQLCLIYIIYFIVCIGRGLEDWNWMNYQAMKLYRYQVWSLLW